MPPIARRFVNQSRCDNCYRQDSFFPLFIGTGASRIVLELAVSQTGAGCRIIWLMGGFDDLACRQSSI